MPVSQDKTQGEGSIAKFAEEVLKPDDNDEMELRGGTTDPRMVNEGESTEEAQASIARPDIDVDVLLLQGGDSNPVNEYKKGSSGGGSQVMKNVDVLFYYQDTARMLYKRKQEKQREAMVEKERQERENAARTDPLDVHREKHLSLRVLQFMLDLHEKEKVTRT